jgi:hypothetical protein
MARGDHLQASRPGYHHDGIDIGDGTIVHFAAPPGGTKSAACIRIDPFDVFAGDGVVMVRPYAEYVDREAVVSRALSCLGKGGYDLGWNNCEHFAYWCVTETHSSEQVKRFGAGTALLGTSVISAGLGLDFVGTSGAITNLSAAGIMAGLKSIGGVLGMGSAAGIVMLAAAPAAVGTGVMHYALRDVPSDTPAERHARAVGRVGAAGGAALGAAGGIWAVGAMGVPGLSAAGITSGLAAVGSLVSRGMTAGLACLIVLPVVLALLIGYVAYSAARPNPIRYLPG